MWRFWLSPFCFIFLTFSVHFSCSLNKLFFPFKKFLSFPITITITSFRRQKHPLKWTNSYQHENFYFRFSFQLVFFCLMWIVNKKMKRRNVKISEIRKIVCDSWNRWRWKVCVDRSVLKKKFFIESLDDGDVVVVAIAVVFCLVFLYFIVLFSFFFALRCWCCCCLFDEVFSIHHNWFSQNATNTIHVKKHKFSSQFFFFVLFSSQ